MQMRWHWHHAEYHTHMGWVPQATIHVYDDGQRNAITVGEPDLALDTRQAARDRNEQLVKQEVARREWAFMDAHDLAACSP